VNHVKGQGKRDKGKLFCLLPFAFSLLPFLSGR
jgi:hypothetical protein